MIDDHNNISVYYINDGSTSNKSTHYVYHQSRYGIFTMLYYLDGFDNNHNTWNTIISWTKCVDVDIFAGLHVAGDCFIEF